MHSIWEEPARSRSFSPLDRNISTEVLIIGGGMCGAP